MELMLKSPATKLVCRQAIVHPHMSHLFIYLPTYLPTYLPACLPTYLASR